MFTSKICSDGDRLTVEIPAELLNEIRTEPGAQVVVSRTADGALRIDPHDPEFSKLLESGRTALRDFRHAIRALASAA